MNIDTNRIRNCLQCFDFRNLFIEELGWNICNNRPIDVQVDTQTFCFTPFAEQGGMVIYLGESSDGNIPPSSVRRAIETRITKQTHEHMIVFIDKDRTKSVWQWVRRQQGKQTAAREHTYHKGQPGDSLLQKLAGIAFSIDDLDEEGRVAIIEVTRRVAKAFDLEKVTRRFYDEFKKEHDNFSRFLKGLEVQDELSWYTSVMLNRLMFIYFIQKKEFLDGDIDYLAHKLRESKARSSNQFYSQFLIHLFFDGFAKEEKDRSPEVNQLLGKVPYLNGGLFLPHQLELAHGENITISDAAFEQLFTFFDRYNWHLDYRPLRADNEINPDVLGYIFEKYINQKQMGAYYTKEDITGYICKSTILPFLFDRLEGMRYNELHPFPMKDVEPYIYDTVKQEDNLPTETEREYQIRQRCYRQIKEDFADGKITGINSLITYNLDICKFAEDWVRGIKDPVTLRAFYFHCLTKVTILDPAVGSGAFLFAALNILEPLYEICLDKMLELEEPKYPDFTKELKRISQHPNRNYFVLKSIIINNLFGVDIMEEAVEICKLRLFLKLVSQVDEVEKIEPLPDIDFNIRPGNTLVGFTSMDAVREAITTNKDNKGNIQARMLTEQDQTILRRIEAEAQMADHAFVMFREIQTRYGIDAGEFTKAKVDLNNRLDSLRCELDRYLAAEYRIDLKNATAYEKWRTSHQPFHWFVEFYGIMHNGGFDVIIGNPPYVTVPKDLNRALLQNTFKSALEQWSRDENLYTLFVERSLRLCKTASGHFGMILPLSLSFSTKRPFAALRMVLAAERGLWHWSHFDRIPSALFGNDVRTRCTIGILARSLEAKRFLSATTALLRWNTEYRDFLFKTMKFTMIDLDIVAGIPKVSTQIQADVLKDLFNKNAPLARDLEKPIPFSVLTKVTPSGVGWI